METITNAVQKIRTFTSAEPSVGLILGSGLGDYADSIENPAVIPYSEIPGFPLSTVQGHAGRFVIGERQGKTVIAMQGRVHCYEGYTPQQVTLPVRIMKLLGVKTLILTNAAGGIDKDFAVGALMMITDHINYSGLNPLTGANLDEFGVRFPDMSQVYSPDLRGKLKAAALANDIHLREGVYVMFAGPSYETPAEIRFARTMGAAAVGMSTVPEAIAARHSGMEVLGLSCITNPAAGILDQPLTHAEIIETTNRVHGTFVTVLDLALGIV